MTPAQLDAVTNPLRRDLPAGMVPKPCCVVLFGATGDLTKRKLIPALYNLAREGFLPPGFTAIGVARRPFTDEEFRGDLREACDEHSRDGKVLPEVWEDFANGIFYHALQFDDPNDYAGLKERITTIEAQRKTGGNRLYYLAVDPVFFAPVAEHLKTAGLVESPQASVFTRIVVEKPIGHDMESARELNRRLQSAFDESQIYRIDHYLGKETVQNILALRFANAIYEPLWNRRYVDHVQITVSERVGMEGRRGQYYDTAGATRDMVQNHMMQLLSLVAMEPPAAIEARTIRDEKVKVLRAIRPLPLDALDTSCIRGQYGPGSFAGKNVKGYREEQGVDPNSRTETFVGLKLQIDTWRWSGVPFFLRTGKRLPKRATEIAIQFRSPPMAMFGETAHLSTPKNQLILRVQPDEGVSLSFDAKVPGMRMQLRPVKMDFRYGSSFGAESPEAYERLLLDAMLGDSTLFIRADEVEYAWNLISPLLDAWRESPPPAFPNYDAGTWGPPEVDQLFEGTDGAWRML